MTATTPADPKPGSRGYLKWYWTRSPEGLAKWQPLPHPWTSLRDHLLKYMKKEEADRTASAWFQDVFGYASGSRKGKNPVGPG